VLFLENDSIETPVSVELVLARNWVHCQRVLLSLRTRASTEIAQIHHITITFFTCLWSFASQIRYWKEVKIARWRSCFHRSLYNIKVLNFWVRNNLGPTHEHVEEAQELMSFPYLQQQQQTKKLPATNMVVSTYSINSFLLELEPTSVLSASFRCNQPPVLEWEPASSFWWNWPPTGTGTACSLLLVQQASY
jgi:hypothetical protein